MYSNIDTIHLEKLYTKEPEARLVVETLLENHKRILSTISHEIRNPLSLLYGNMQLLEHALPELLDNRFWRNAIGEFQYTHSLLDELSQFNNSGQLQLITCDGFDYLSDIFSNYQGTLSSSDPTFQYLVDISENVILDKSKCKQVLLNLLKNAREACDISNTINVRCNIENSMLHIHVSDDGHGISKDILPTIFQPFVSHKVGGTGLGLAICKEIVTAHEGTIAVDSKLNQGTTFYITLPIA